MQSSVGGEFAQAEPCFTNPYFLLNFKSQFQFQFSTLNSSFQFQLHFSAPKFNNLFSSYSFSTLDIKSHFQLQI